MSSFKLVFCLSGMVLILHGCSRLFPAPPLPPPPLELKSGDTIPGEFIIDFQKGVTEIEKESFRLTFQDIYRDAVRKKLKIKPDEPGPSIQFFEEKCDCIEPKSLYSIRHQHSGSSGSSSGTLSPEEVEASENSMAFEGVGPEGRCFAEEHEAGESDIAWVGLSPEESTLDSLVDSIPWLEGIRPNIFISPPKISQLGLGSCIPNTAGYPNSTEADMTIAILDSGVDPCLFSSYKEQMKIWAMSDEDYCIEGANGQILGWNFIENNDDLTDELSHGTKVVGVLDQKLSEVISRDCTPKYMFLKIFTECYGSTFHASCAVDFALANGADVINASWGIYNEDVDIQQSLSYTETYKTPFVCSAGNEQEILGLTGGTQHLPSDGTIYQDLNMVLSISGLLPSSYKLWGWTNAPDATGLNNYLVPVPESGGTNLYAKMTNLCEPAITEVYFNLSGIGSPSFSIGVQGTSFSAPQATAKVVGHMYCASDPGFGGELFDRATTSLSNPIGNEGIRAQEGERIHDVKIRQLKNPDCDHCND